MKTKKYILSAQGTSFPEGTPQSLIDCLESLRQSKERVTIHYHSPTQDPNTFTIWHEKGTISRTCGQIKSPILIHNSRSLGGGLIDSDRIYLIESSRKRKGKTYWSSLSDK